MIPTLKFEDYKIGWICALQIEAEAAIVMLDEEHEGRFPTIHGDDNTYTPGTIQDHNVIIVQLPKKETGTISAATSVSQMRQTFTRLKYGFMVGTGGGVPGEKLDPDIRLGDIVVALPGSESQGIVGYDSGKETVEGFQMTGWLSPTNRKLRTVIEAIQTRVEVKGRNNFIKHLEVFYADNPQTKKFVHPAARGIEDHLHDAKRPSRIVKRPTRSSQDPVVHHGLIGSGNRLVKKAEFRDTERDRYKIICFDMEAAGIMNTLPVAVIRGISDYADKYKNDDWQPYAAAVAAAYTKGLLSVLGPDPSDISEPPVDAGQFNHPYSENQ